MERRRGGRMPAMAMTAAAALLIGGTPSIVGSARPPPPPPATAAEAGSPPESPAPSPSSLPDGWPGFRIRAEGFSRTAGDAIAGIREAMLSGNAGAVVERIRAAALAGTDLLAWLDANPPEVCYADAWQALHDATDQLVPMFTGLAADGLDGAMDGLIDAGTALVAADDGIAEAASACRPSPPSPDGSPRTMLATR